jgi:hypothetical protein
MKISKIKLTLALMGLFTSASAQERMDLSKAKHYAQITRQNTEQFKHAPLSFEADIEQPVALANDSFGGLVMVYGKSKTPLFTVNLTEREPFQEMPLDMSADESGNVTVHISGKYHARFKVAELYL